MTLVAGALAILVAAFVKGAVAFGFPLVATPLLALVVGVKTAVAVSIIPNIAMDSVQLVRRGHALATVRRMLSLIVFSMIGMWLGTLLLAILPGRVATLVLGVFVLAFAAVNATGLAPRVPAAWEPWLSPPVGLVAGVLGGLTNVPGTPMVLYFVALGLDKYDFVRAVAVTFVVVKVVQLGAVAWYGLLDGRLLAISLGFSVVALAGFAVGARLQDWLPARVFNRAVLGLLVITGAWLIYRGLST
ncbi:MAG TPA: sulfite exporter TauE/SafE family protein [Candidatus Binatia bacterium]|nr:sulfite exporter TauE/SafE family protein [Candidatus Binatia bacterium]